MEARIVDFPQTRIAVLEHHGSPQLEHESVRKLVAWRIENRLPPDRHRTFGIHYDNPHTTPPHLHRMDLCIEIDRPVAANDHGVIEKTIPACRCAVARHIGPRDDITTATWLCNEWLPRSGETPGEFPIFFHYVNVGPNVQHEEMITDVYLPLR